MPKYKNKPVVIEAFQMTKKRRWDNSEWPNWLNAAWQGDKGIEGSMWIDDDDPMENKLVCGTLKGVHHIDWNDWIIRGVEGEIYPCEPSIFEETYEKADDSPPH